MLGIFAVLLMLIKMVGLRQMAEPLLLAWSSKGISQTLWRKSCFNRRPCDIFSMGPYPNIRLPRCKEQAFSNKLVSLAFFDQSHKSWFGRTRTDLHTVWGLPKHNNPHLQKMLHVTILQKWTELHWFEPNELIMCYTKHKQHTVPTNIG